jgi:hypothetical protein
MTHTPVTTSALLIKFIICAHPHPKASLEHYQLASPPSTEIEGDTWKQTNVDVDQG